MPAHLLDNPLWHALATHHARLAAGPARMRRYPADVAPFFAVADDAAGATIAPLAPLAPGEAVSFVGVVPALPPGWAVEVDTGLLQMTASAPVAIAPAGPAVVALTEADVPEMLALTALVFPGYFRPRTIAMGTYLGIRVDGRLAAMAGERMHLTGHCELSGVCTHPDHTGRGYARHLCGLLLNAILARGEAPFLHVMPDNTGAIRIYEALGFTGRRELRLCRVRAPE